MLLHELRPAKAYSKIRRRFGRGNGSKRGNFCGKGCKGQTARTGGRRRPGFEGGQTPLLRKMPKLKGFKNINHQEFSVLNVGDLNVFENNTEITAEKLFEQGLLKKNTPRVKILGSGFLNKKLQVKMAFLSEKAKLKIEKAGGTVVAAGEIKGEIKNEKKISRPKKTEN